MSEVQTTGTREMEARGKQAVEREGTRPGWVFRPDVDIVERQDEYVVTADVPGVDESGVSIEFKEGVLSIDGTLGVHPDPSWRLVHGEYRMGSYHRSFALSEDIDVDRIAARISDGVLELRLPKAERHQPRRIEVARG